jgi:hypothetical protein
MKFWTIAVLVLAVAVSSHAAPLELTGGVIVVESGERSVVEATAARVLAEELEKRTGWAWSTAEKAPASGAAMVLYVGKPPRLRGRGAPDAVPPKETDGIAVAAAESKAGATVWLGGADARGALYAVGYFLRQLHWESGRAWLPEPVAHASSPEYAIRGHQIGYRAKANSYDAWTPAQMEQYIRELAFFGINAIENIPFQDDDESPHMPVTRAEMNRAMSDICRRYGLEYWAWTPAEFDLNDADKRTELLDKNEAFYQDCPRLDAVFFPGGDPGGNHPELVMPFLADVAVRLAKYHPEARIWMSLQGFEDDMVDYFYAWIEEHQPEWFGGAVGGPSSPPLKELRERLPARYALRDYPDITHTVRSQYATAWIDPAFAFTLGREGTNPEPVYYATIHRATAPHTNGFITYSDGVHDDLNKTVWSGLGWDQDYDLNTLLAEYARVFFGPGAAARAAAGLFALERNWSGALAENGGVDATLALWQALEAERPALAGNWRWQLYLMRAYYDGYTRHRLLYEEALEDEANAALTLAEDIGAEAAMDRAIGILARADQHVATEWRERVVALCDDLFRSIGLQTSVEKYQASGAERGAVLDFLDHPLNNRWWLEDQFAEITALTNESERLDRLELIRTWENPGPGSYYDDIGNVSKSPRVIRGEALATDPFMQRNPNPDFMWWDNGRSRLRPSWISKMTWPLGLRYTHLDPQATYTIRTTGLGQCLLSANGQRLTPTLDGKEIGEFKEFPVPQALLAGGELHVTFETPNEPGINWRQVSRLTEIWLLKGE